MCNTCPRVAVRRVRACIYIWTCVSVQSGQGYRERSMSDFPSSKCPPIPWRDAVQRVPLGSTMAPGPPTAQPASGKRKIPRAVAASLRGLVPPDDDRSYPKYVVNRRCLSRLTLFYLSLSRYTVAVTRWEMAGIPWLRITILQSSTPTTAALGH